MNQYHTTNVFPLILNLSPKSMLSLYIHIPFCRHKCKYCSFFVLPEDGVEDAEQLEQLKERYLEQLLEQSRQWREHFPEEQIRTIYIGGGTPFQLGADRLSRLIDTLLEQWGSETLEELTIELNPDPFDEVIAFVDKLGKEYRQLYRIRCSFGIQSFDDKVLQASKRNYLYNNLIGFLRELQTVKQPGLAYNFDFIAFGQFQTDKQGNQQLRDKHRRQFFTKFVDSKVADGFSLYTLELFPGSDRYYRRHDELIAQHTQASDDQIIQEFELLSGIITHAGYRRYELSNFALPGKVSIHNMVYWKMQPYLGIGINAASRLPREMLPADFLPSVDESTQAVRFAAARHWKQYRSDQLIDLSSLSEHTRRDVQFERAMLALRTSMGIEELTSYESLLVPDRA